MSSTILLGNISGILSTASLILTLVILAFVALGTFLAYRRGLVRTALRLGTLITAIAFSLLGAYLLKDAIGSLLEGLLGDVVSTSLTEASPTLADLIKGLPGALAAPFIFLALFIIINAIFLIVYHILKRIPIFKITLSNKLLDHILGAVVGLLCSLLLVSCFLIPFAGYVGVADDVLTNVEQTNLDEETAQEITSVHQDYVAPLADNVVFVISDTLLGDIVFETLVSCEVQGDSVNLVEELSYLTQTYSTMSPLIEVDFEFARFGKDQGDALRSFANNFDKSVLIPHIICELLPKAANQWYNGEEFGGIASPADSVPENLDSLMDNTLYIMKTTTRETLKGDLVTLCELLATMAENGTLGAMENATSRDVLQTLSDPGVVSGLIDILYANERTRILVADLSNIGFDAISDSLDIPESNKEVRDQLSADLNEAIRKATELEDYTAQIDDLTERISNIFDEYGMEASEKEAKLYAEAIIGYGPITSVGDGEAIADTYFSIIGAAMAQVNGNASAGGVTMLSSSMEEDERDAKLLALIRDYQAQNGTNSLKDTQKLTNMINGKTALVHKTVTGNQIHVDENELFIGTAESFHNQTKALEEILIILSAAIPEDDETSSIDYKTIDTQALSSALHKLAGTRTDADGNTIANLGSALTNIIKYTLMQIGIDPAAADELINHIVENEKDSTDGKKDTLSAAISLVTVFENQSDSENMKEQVNTLMQGLDGDSAKILSNCVSPNLIKNYTTGDFDKERTTALCDVTKDMLNNFGNHSDDLSEEQLDAEATYMQTIFALATTSDENTAERLFQTEENEESKLGKTADEFVSSVQNSVVISETFLNETDSLKISVGNQMKVEDKALLKVAVDSNTDLNNDMRNALTVVFSLNEIAE